MEKLLIIVVAIVLLAIAALFFLGLRSQTGEIPGLVDGQLKSCPNTPNCVCSEFEADTDHYIEPLDYSAEQAGWVLATLKNTIAEMGGTLQAETSDYLAATFTSPVFRFVDDLEVRIDSERQTIHLRSASRIGRSDLDANRKRVERLIALFEAKSG